jgi:hypothetical protein
MSSWRQIVLSSRPGAVTVRAAGYAEGGCRIGVADLGEQLAAGQQRHAAPHARQDAMPQRAAEE